MCQLFMYILWYMINESSNEGGGYCFVKLWGQGGQVQRGGTHSWDSALLLEVCAGILFPCSGVISNFYCFQIWFFWLIVFPLSIYANNEILEIFVLKLFHFGFFPYLGYGVDHSVALIHTGCSITAAFLPFYSAWRSGWWSAWCCACFCLFY